MMILLFTLLSILVLGAIAALAHWLRARYYQRRVQRGEMSEEDVPATFNPVDMECCGQHEVCEKDSLLAALSKEVEYYNDEELDRFRGRRSDEYDEDEVAEFADILYTMRSDEVAGWVRSLQLRQVELPDAMKEEVILIVGERRTAVGGVKLGALLPYLIILLGLTACSTKQNTAMTRAYHAMTAHYNTLYNGQVAYEEALQQQQRGHKEDYNRLLPMYISTNKATAGTGKGGYQTAITKCEKAIKVHSIKKRPKAKNVNRRKTERQKAFLARREFNPYLYRAWLMMADAQFNSGEFFEAASTYNYIIRLYHTQPDIVCVARARLARCYVALEWPYDAEDLLGKIRRDSITRKGLRESDNTTAGYYILTGDYEKALPALQRTIRHTRGNLARSRLRFLEGQLQQQLGHNEEAYKAYARVQRAHPPYEMTFNARIAQTEVMPRSKYSTLIKRLRAMARDEKNKDYLDRVYYALGNVYLGRQDTMRCLYTWETGVEKATRNGPDKAALLLHLGNLYWEKEMYIEAAEAYKKCVGVLSKEHEQYNETKRREEILRELEPHLSAIKLQDSLQALARMPEAQYMAAIDRVIDALKKKEKEEAKKLNKASAAANAARAASNAPASNTPAMPQPTMGGNQQSAIWYFYNAAAMKRGVQEFQRRWGRRPNEDFWRISNKRTLPATDTFNPEEQEEFDEAKADSLFGAEVSGGDNNRPDVGNDSLANDPHHREYYLKQIPFTEEQMEESKTLLSNGLYNAGMMEQELLENFPLAEYTMQRLLTEFPEYEGREKIYYYLFLLYGRLGRVDEAEHYRQMLLEEFPEDKLAQLLANPYYEQIARQGKHMEDSLYAEAYDAYQVGNYERVEQNYRFSTDNFPEGKHRARMLFVRAMSQLYGGSRDSFLVSLKEVIEKFPKEEVTELANSIMKGLKDGRLLQDDRYDASSIWARRAWMEEGDSTKIDTLTDDRITTFNFVLAYPTASVDEHQLLFEMARYNFSNYTVRNFDIEIREDRGLNMLLVRGFLSYDEVHTYVQKLYADEHMRNRLEGIRSLLISDDNLKLLGTTYSFDDYKEFYDRYFAPMEVPEDLRLDKPAELEIIQPDDYDPNEKTEEEKKQEEEQHNAADDYDDFFDNL